MECAGCGAALGPTDAACRYCRRPSPLALERAKAEAAQQAKERAAGAAREQSALRTQLESASKRTLVFSLLAFITCLLPVFPILSLLAYRRARELARQLSVDVPGHATFGLVLSSISLVMMPLTLVVGYFADSAAEERTEKRIATLEAQLATAAVQPTLDLTTACALAELYALKNGYSDQRGKHFEHFDCGGSMSGTPTRPVLDRLAFTTDVNDTRYDVSACLERGERWFVRELRADHACPSTR